MDFGETVCFCCCIIKGNYLFKQDTRMYKRRGDADKRCERLKELDAGEWRVLAAQGWFDPDEEIANEDDDLPAWAIQAASEAFGYEQLADAPENKWSDIYDLAETMAV